jgi:trimethylamine:corrinoid methyltransferase-like protein
MTFKILSEEQLSKIHCSSMHVLEKVGIEVPHGEILSRFSDFGAAVDMKKKESKNTS